MRFNYEYRTHENELKTGSLSASSRDAAYAALKKEGIKPSRVVLAPGFANRLASFGWRVWIIIALSLLLGAAAYLIFSPRVPVTYSLPAPFPQPTSTNTVSKEEMEDYISSLNEFKSEYRAKILDRVKKGDLSQDEAARLLTALGID